MCILQNVFKYPIICLLHRKGMQKNAFFMKDVIINKTAGSDFFYRNMEDSVSSLTKKEYIREAYCNVRKKAPMGTKWGGGVKALVAGPLRKNTFFVASLI